ncbi:MAG: sugar ABC transporter substrate-binding protein [Streptococcaceae bacterium]|jgi:ABC-type glycerol-3-phosphate transport system substrate-binding protein|nr:sugar ABC transporter substrate-binding protein [Streptococcaceae bacterium]
MKLKKKLLAAATVALGVIALAACSSGNSSKQSSSGSSGKEIILWTFADMKPQIKEYEKLNPKGYKIKETVIPYADFQTKLDKVLGTDKAPDMIAMDAGFVSKYVDSGMLADLKDYGVEEATTKSFPYTLDIGKDSKGTQVAVSYQAAPGAVYYRASLLQQYLGIAPSDQTAAQAAFASWDKVQETAQTIHDKSGGKAYLFSSLQDMYMPAIGGRTEGWVDKDNKLQIDPTLLTSLDMMKTFVEKGLTKNTVGQNSDWFAGMSSNDIVSYSLPSWGLFYWLKDYSKDTAGDWRVIQGPQSYSWGGTWFGAVKGTEHEENAAKLAIYWSTDTEFQTWQAQANTDFVADQEVDKTVAADYAKNPVEGSPIGTQNPYSLFSEAAKNINGKIITKYDQNIQDLWINDVINPYSNGKTTKEKALATFKADVKSAYPDVTTD